MDKFPASRLKTDQFFLYWLALPENQELVRSRHLRKLTQLPHVHFISVAGMLRAWERLSVEWAARLA
jgi:hypothetical protein